MQGFGINVHHKRPDPGNRGFPSKLAFEWLMLSYFQQASEHRVYGTIVFRLSWGNHNMTGSVGADSPGLVKQQQQRKKRIVTAARREQNKNAQRTYSR